MQTIGNYELVEMIAEGGMGTVYRGRHRDSGEVVAVKVVPPHIASNAVYVKRFEQEYLAARALDHPNIVKALDFGRENKSPFLVMEFVEGESIGQKLDREQRIAEAEAIKIIAQVAMGLHKAHQLGLIHRDVKPDNILLTREGQAKLTDMGLIKEIDSDLNLTRTGRGLGTPHFMAPEQFRNAKGADARCDIYSLGATLYMMVTGVLPFQSNGPLDAWMKKLKNEIAPPRELLPALSERVDWAIRRAMSPDPAQRPDSCEEFIEDLTGKRAQSWPTLGTIEPEVADLWFLRHTDAEGVAHTTRGTTAEVRSGLHAGIFGANDALTLARAEAGPFEPARHFPEFRDLLIVPGTAPVPAPEPPAAPRVVTAPPPPSARQPGLKPTAPVALGPHYDLGQVEQAHEWLGWLALTALAAAAGILGYLALPHFRWRRP